MKTMTRSLFAALSAAAVFAAGAAPAANLKTAIFAGGCFWSMEKAFEHQPGVVSAVSGYGGGTDPHPTYERHPGYLESVKVTYDPAKVSYAQLVDHYYHSIDPTDPDGEICDKGPSYHLAVFVSTPEERQVADAEKARIEKLLGRRVTVATRPTSTFYAAEAYHQDFAEKNPIAYERYFIGCGRGPALKAVWGGR